MSDLKNVIALLKSKLAADVYSGQIPESQPDPAVVVTNVATPFKGRDTEGRRYGNSSVWRLTVVAELQSDVELVLKDLDKLDNTSNVDFQRIYSVLVNSELGLNDEPYRRAFVDMTVYKR